MKRKTKTALCAFLDGWMDDTDDMPDGAWQCVAMDGVDVFNKEYGHSIDPHDGWMLWVKYRAALHAAGGEHD